MYNDEYSVYTFQKTNKQTKESVSTSVRANQTSSVYQTHILLSYLFLSQTNVLNQQEAHQIKEAGYEELAGHDDYGTMFYQRNLYQ